MAFVTNPTTRVLVGDQRKIGTGKHRGDDLELDATTKQHSVSQVLHYVRDKQEISKQQKKLSHVSVINCRNQIIISGKRCGK